MLDTVKVAPRMAWANCRCRRQSAFRAQSGEMMMDAIPREITLLQLGLYFPLIQF